MTNPTRSTPDDDLRKLLVDIFESDNPGKTPAFNNTFAETTDNLVNSVEAELGYNAGDLVSDQAIQGLGNTLNQTFDTIDDTI